MMGQKEAVQGGVGRITYEQKVERRMVLLESLWVSSGQRCSEAIHPLYEERGIGALEVEDDCQVVRCDVRQADQVDTLFDLLRHRSPAGSASLCPDVAEPIGSRQSAERQ